MNAYEPQAPMVKLFFEKLKAGCIAGELPKSRPLKIYLLTRSAPKEKGDVSFASCAFKLFPPRDRRNIKRNMVVFMFVVFL